MRTVRRYMCRNVICAQLLNVGVSPSSKEPIRVNSRFDSSLGRINGSGNQLTLIPPSLPYPQIFTIFSLRYLYSFLTGLWYCIIPMPSTFLDQDLCYPVRNVCFSDTGGTFTNFSRKLLSGACVVW